MVDEWCKHITEEDCQHHAFGITRVHHTDDDRHCSDKEAEDIFTCLCAGRSDGVGSHEDGTESKAT